MLGTRDPQRTFFGAIAQLGIDVVARMGFYGQLGLNWWTVFKDEDFSGAYELDNGRPSVPPTMLAIARLLQHYDGISDAEVIERCRYDMRYKVALDLDAYSIEAPFAKSTFQAFRVRLTLHATEGLAFEQSIRLARKNGMLPKKLRVALDSSPVRGKGAVKDTFALLSDAIAEVIRSVARKTKQKPEKVANEIGLGRHVNANQSIKGSEIVDWDSDEDVSRFLYGLLRDCDTVVSLAEKAECATDEVELLKKIVDQDIEQEENTPKIRRGVEPGRTPSVTDPEMRHGRKSSGKVFTGHKAHVAADAQSGVITAIDVSSPCEADGSKVEDLIEKSRETTGCEIEEALGDCAYSTNEAQKQAGECGVNLKTKMPSPPKGQFGPGDFKLSVDDKMAICPAGHFSEKRYNYKTGICHFWSPELCGACPLKAKCTRASRRKLLVGPNFHSRRRRERWARSKEGRMELHSRVVAEHCIGRVKNLGAGTARYLGRLKTKGQWLWTSAVVNLSLIWSKTAGQPG